MEYTFCDEPDPSIRKWTRMQHGFFPYQTLLGQFDVFSITVESSWGGQTKSIVMIWEREREDSWCTCVYLCCRNRVLKQICFFYQKKKNKFVLLEIPFMQNKIFWCNLAELAELEGILSCLCPIIRNRIEPRDGWSSSKVAPVGRKWSGVHALQYQLNGWKIVQYKPYNIGLMGDCSIQALIDSKGR